MRERGRDDPRRSCAGYALQVRGLHKAYGGKVAVGGLDLDIPASSFFGLVGPNGAGKTTTLKMCTGLLRPDAGAVWVDGTEVWHNLVRAKAVIGVLPEDLLLLRAAHRERAAHLQRPAAGPARGHGGRSLEGVARDLRLTDAAATMVIDYSHGMRRRSGWHAP